MKHSEGSMVRSSRAVSACPSAVKPPASSETNGAASRYMRMLAAMANTANSDMTLLEERSSRSGSLRRTCA